MISPRESFFNEIVQGRNNYLGTIQTITPVLIKNFSNANDTKNSGSNDDVNVMTVMIIFFENNTDFLFFWIFISVFKRRASQHHVTVDKATNYNILLSMY